MIHFLQVHQESVMCKLDVQLRTLESSGIGPVGVRWLSTCIVVTEVSNSTSPLQAHLHSCVTALGIVIKRPEVSACNGNC